MWQSRQELQAEEIFQIELHVCNSTASNCSKDPLEGLAFTGAVELLCRIACTNMICMEESSQLIKQEHLMYATQYLDKPKAF